MTRNIKQMFKSRENFMMKFDDAPFTDGTLSPGWAEPTYDKFFIRMVDEPKLLNQSTVFPMTNLQHDLDDLDLTVELESQRNTTTGVSLGLTDVETAPNKTRKQLTAQPLQAKTIITDNFLDENIEKEGFMDTYINLLAEQMGPAFQRWGMFADTSVATQTGEGTGYKMTNGLLAQAKEISSGDGEEYGLSKLVYQNKIGEGILDAIVRYIDQDGDTKGATCLLPPSFYSRLMVEIANDRNTALGDAVYRDGKLTYIHGVLIDQDNNLRQTRNAYNSMKFTDGEYSATGTAVDKMQYGVITKPDNIIFGMMKEIRTVNQWDIDVLGYKVAGLCKGDVKIHYDQDTLFIPFTRNTAPSS